MWSLTSFVGFFHILQQARMKINWQMVFVCCYTSQSGCSFWITQVFMPRLRSSILDVHHVTASEFFWKFCIAGILFKFSSTSLRCCSGSCLNIPWEEHFHTPWENGKIIQAICYPSMHSDIAGLVKLLDDSLLQEEVEERSAPCWNKPSSPAVTSG